MLADIAHHQTVALIRRHLGNAAVAIIPPHPALSPSGGEGGMRSTDMLDEMDVPPRHRAEIAVIVVAMTGKFEIISGQQVPFLAGDLAGLAAYAQRRVGEKPVALSRL